MKRYQITLDGRTFDVRVLSDPRQEQVQVEVNGRPFTVEIRRPSPAGEPTGTMPSPSGIPPQGPGIASIGSKLVTAPLPGLIKSVTVRPGQRVAPGEELLVIEAMKMDNVIRAGREGTIGTVYVAEGRRVAHGERLLEYQD